MVAMNEITWDHPSADYSFNGHDLCERPVKNGFCDYSDGSRFHGLCKTAPKSHYFIAPLNRFDPESELYSVRNRTYNPPHGQRIQRAPIGYATGANPYLEADGYFGCASGPGKLPVPVKLLQPDISSPEILIAPRLHPQAAPDEVSWRMVIEEVG